MGEAFKFGFGNAKSKKYVDLKDNKILRTKENFIDEDKEMLVAIGTGNYEIQNKELTKLKKRKLIEDKQETFFIITKGENYMEKKA